MPDENRLQVFRRHVDEGETSPPGPRCRGSLVDMWGPVGARGTIQRPFHGRRRASNDQEIRSCGSGSIAVVRSLPWAALLPSRWAEEVGNRGGMWTTKMKVAGCKEKTKSSGIWEDCFKVVSNTTTLGHDRDPRIMPSAPAAPNLPPPGPAAVKTNSSNRCRQSRPRDRGR